MTVAKRWAGRWYVVALVALFLGWIPKIQASKVVWARDNDFAHSYLTAVMVREGSSPYNKDLLALYSQYNFTPTIEIAKATNPPPLASVMAPLTFLSPDTAYAVWIFVQLISLAGGVLLLISALDIRVSNLGRVGLIVGAIAPISTLALFRFGQSQGMIFFFLSLAVWCARRRSWWLSPFCLGVSSSFKLFTLPLVFVALRYWGVRGVALFVVGVAALWVPFVMMCGVQGVSDFVFSTLPYVRSLSLAFDGNISLSGAVTYTLETFGITASHLSVPLQIVNIFLLTVLVYVDYRRSQERRDLARSVAYVVALCVLFSPTAWPHYVPLLTLLFLCLVRDAQRSPSPDREMVLVVGLYVCVASVLGFERRADVITQLVSAWWAPGWMGIASWRLMARSYRLGIRERAS